MPSDLLNLLYKGAREALAKNVPPEIKISTLNLVINQIEDEVKICDNTVNESRATLAIFSPSIHQKIGLNNEIKLADLEKNRLIKLKEEVEEFIEIQKSLINQSGQTKASRNESSGDNEMKIFISHSEKDKEIAESLINYIQPALTLADKDIICTSVSGHKLQFGKSIAEILRDNIALAPTLIVLVTEDSIKATWVMFELGAAWALKRNIIPILAPGILVKDLPSLLSSITCISIDNLDASSRLSGLVHQLSDELNLQLNLGEKSQAKLESFVRLFREYKSRKSEKSGIQPESTNTVSDSRVGNDHKDIEELIIREIINLDRDEYYIYGYKIEKISEKTNLDIPKCKFALASLIKKGYIKKNNVIGGSHDGEHYGFTDNGLILIKEHILSA